MDLIIRCRQFSPIDSYNGYVTQNDYKQQNRAYLSSIIPIISDKKNWFHFINALYNIRFHSFSYFGIFVEENANGLKAFHCRSYWDDDDHQRHTEKL